MRKTVNIKKAAKFSGVQAVTASRAAKEDGRFGMSAFKIAGLLYAVDRHSLRHIAAEAGKLYSLCSLHFPALCIINEGTDFIKAGGNPYEARVFR